MLKNSLLALLILSFALPAVAAAPAYHLELEAHPAAAFPYFSKFGTVDLHVYAGGVSAEVLWLNAFSRNGAPDVTVTNPLARMYVDVAIGDISSIVKNLAAGAGKVEQSAAPPSVQSGAGKVKGVAAVRHRLSWGPEAYIDYWTTTTLADNPQLRRIVNELLRGVSPNTAAVASRITGVPIYVELNFRRFKKVPLVTMKKLTLNSDDEKSALERGPLYVRAGVLEKLWEK
ncbi:MAG: hypothetical protein WA208_19850 [Thermoanaerobaculia bacterium]